MKNARFPIYKVKEIQRLNPCWSSYVCFCEALSNTTNISVRTLKKYFDLLIDKDDYSKSDKGQIVKYLEKTFLQKA